MQYHLAMPRAKRYQRRHRPDLDCDLSQHPKKPPEKLVFKDNIKTALTLIREIADQMIKRFLWVAKRMPLDSFCSALWLLNSDPGSLFFAPIKQILNHKQVRRVRGKQLHLKGTKFPSQVSLRIIYCAPLPSKPCC